MDNKQHSPLPWQPLDEKYDTQMEVEQDPCGAHIAIQSQAAKIAELEEYAREATKTITSLTAGGSEYFGKKIGEIYTADLPYCLAVIQKRKDSDFEAVKREAKARKAAEAKIAEQTAVIEQMQEALGIYADGRSWESESVCDPNSYRFEGLSIARTALAANKTGDA
jgi:phosphoribosyl-ATP pyrophosphohydrolase